MTTLQYRLERQVPVALEADVLVVGGGPGGLGAAVMAARRGARTALVERYGFMGGMAASGEVHPFMTNHVDDVPLDGPVYTDWIAAMDRYRSSAGKERYVAKDAAMLAAEDLCLEAGVELLYHHQLADVLVRDRQVEGLVLLSKSGLTAARAAQYVDCTGDADLAFRAGCRCEQGGPSGHCQPMTLCFKLGGVDVGRMPGRPEINRLYDEARARGEVDCPRENILLFHWFEADVIHFNTTRVIHRSGTSGAELSDAEIQARRQVRQLLRFFRERVPGFEKAQLYSLAHHIGVRESRRVRGRAYLTREAFEGRRKFPDAIARVRYPIDIHNPDGTGTEIVQIPAGDWYEIPYGCVVAADRDNLLVGGRPISVDHAIHSSMRVMPPACTVGQAAGLGAAMA
ncbi:MAG: FAD-dependent oxidoreductase, partial [Gemmatimonadota bacterium]